MSRRRILQTILWLLVSALTIALAISLFHGVVTLIEENKQTKADNIKLYSQNQQIIHQDAKLLKHNNDLQSSIKNLNKTIGTIRDNNAELQKQKQELIKAKDKLLQENSDLKKKVSMSTSNVGKSVRTASPLVSRGTEQHINSRVITMNATAYTASCSGCSGKTRWGNYDLRANPNTKVIAVDPNVIPLGTKVHVEGYGDAVAADTGGAIHGTKIDIFIPRLRDAIQWGSQTVKVTILN